MRTYTGWVTCIWAEAQQFHMHIGGFSQILYSICQVLPIASTYYYYSHEWSALGGGTVVGKSITVREALSVSQISSSAARENSSELVGTRGRSSAQISQPTREPASNTNNYQVAALYALPMHTYSTMHHRPAVNPGDIHG